MVSIYRNPETHKTDLFVNYQQVDGAGLAGTSKSFEYVVELLKSFKLEQTGFIYLVDNKGVVQLHKNNNLLGKASIASLYGVVAGTNLLNKNEFNLSNVNLNGEQLVVASSYISSMGWYIIAQVPHGEIFSSLNDAALQIIFWALLVAAIAAIFTLFLTSSITKPINALAELFTRMGKGNADISYRLPETGQTELVAVAKGYNNFMSNLEATFKEIAQDSAHLKGVVDALKATTESTLSISQINDDNTSHISVALMQIADTVSDVAVNATNAETIAEGMQETTRTVNITINETQQGFDKLASKIDDVSAVIHSLTANTETIATALGVIESISDQTNLLALNAAIEAARAGDHGRGFAVVADEVRTLAGKTAESTTEIKKIMEVLKSTSTSATSEMSHILKQSMAASAAIQNVGEVLSIYDDATNKIYDVNHIVASATEEQSITLRDINSNMSEAQSISQQNKQNIDAISEQASELEALSASLDNLVAAFKRS